jgi:uncharacterized Rmd1/YagE family protein
MAAAERLGLNVYHGRSAVDATATALPETMQGTIPVRTILVGERIETRGLERKESIGTVPLALRLPDGGVVVVFRYGVVVLFNVAPATERAFLEQLGPFVTDPLQPQEVEEARLRVDASVEETIDPSGAIFLKEAKTPALQLVADALAKSLVLSHYETYISGIFDRIEPLAATLREKGRAAFYGRELMRQIGGVLLVEQKMVGRVETSEKPELLWDHPELERLYLRLAEEYELRERVHALDRKRDAISRTVETLLGLVQSRSALRVEWYILALIIAELILSLFPPALWR